MLLNPEIYEDYHIMAALRGPDEEATLVKWIFTSRVRFFAGVKYGVGASVRRSPELSHENLDDAARAIEQRIPLHRDELKHYFYHVHTALSELESRVSTIPTLAGHAEELRVLHEVAGRVEKRIRAGKGDYYALTLQPLLNIGTEGDDSET